MPERQPGGGDFHTPFMETDTENIQLRIAPKFRVDREKQTLHDLAIMTGGRIAAGHAVYLDQKTVQTAHSAVVAAGGQLRAAIRHPSLLDRLQGKQDRVLDMPGFFSDVRVEGNKLVAGKFEFFDSFKESNPKAVQTILEMAEKTPKLFGLSAELTAGRVFVDTDGKEHPAKLNKLTGEMEGAPANVQLANNGLPTLRVQHLGVAAFVDQPAANDGLFSQLSALFSAKPDPDAFGELMKSFLAFAEEHALHTGGNYTKPPTPTTSSPMQIIQSIKAEFSADKAKFAQAMTVLGEKPEITFEALKAELVKLDLAALQAQVTSLSAERDTLKASVATLTTDRDSWKTKFEKLKESGHLGEHNLGPAGGGGGVVNPWLKASENLTQQVELMRDNPTLAATLKAAAGVK